MPDTLIVSLDVGSSSVRTLAFDELGREVPGFGRQLKYRKVETPDGGVEIDPHKLSALSIACLRTIHDQLALAGLKPAAVAFAAFWHSFLGIDAKRKPTTPLLHLFDTRSAAQAERLNQTQDRSASHQRTGCVFHTSYWPAKLQWLADERESAFAQSKHWVSFGEYLFLRLFGEARTLTSMASGSGIWNQNEGRYDSAILAALPIDESQLTPLAAFDEPATRLTAPFAKKWPLFQGIPWLPFGDGACNNIGSGCVSADRFALMVGTSGAMRAVVEAPRMEIPRGLWCYRVDRRRFVLGGALSNGGDVFAWMTRTLQLPRDKAAMERSIAAAEPGAHGLGMLPFFAGERSPYWRGDFRAAITGMSLATTPIEILRASLESVALRFRQIYELLEAGVGRGREVIASGGALLNSPVWTQMMADALGHPVGTCLDAQASARGAALLASERIGAIRSLEDAPPELGAAYQARPENHAKYQIMLMEQQRLIERLFETHGS